MNFSWCLSVRCSVHTLFISLVFCSIYSASSDDILEDLKVTCVLGNTYEMDVELNTVPSGCTSIIVKTDDFMNSDFNSLFKCTSYIPVYMFHNHFTYSDWQGFFQAATLDVLQYIDKINQFHLAGIIFDNMYSSEQCETEDQGIKNGIPRFFEAIRCHYEQAHQKKPKLALAIPFHLSLVRKNLALYFVNDVVDFYYWGTMMNYESKCFSCNDPLYAVIDISIAITEFSTAKEFQCISLSKIVIEVNLFVLDKYNNKLTYGDSCWQCPGYVVNIIPLHTMYRMGQLVSDNELAGGAINYINYDDINGICCCLLKPRYPGLSAFMSGMNQEDKCWNCLSYGIPGIHKRDLVLSIPCPSCTCVPETCNRPIVPKHNP